MLSFPGDTSAHPRIFKGGKADVFITDSVLGAESPEAECFYGVKNTLRG